MSAGRPAAPSATPTVPRRHARPQLSVTITAGRLRKCAPSRSRRRAAEASGSRGSSSTGSVPRSGSTLERSTPALAMMKPSRCSTINTPGRWRTTRCDSLKMTSTSRGSLSTCAASVSALRRRPDLREIDIASFGLGDDLLRHHHDVAIRWRQRALLAGRDEQRGEVVARPHHRKPGNRRQRDGHRRRLLR